MAQSMERIGFIGVGRMGANMARRLKDVGGLVTAVYDVDAQRAASFSQEIGAECALTPARVAELANVVFTVVTDDTGMRGIFAADDLASLLPHVKGRLFVNCATVSPGQGVGKDKASSLLLKALERIRASIYCYSLRVVLLNSVMFRPWFSFGWVTAGQAKRGNLQSNRSFQYLEVGQPG